MMITDPGFEPGVGPNAGGNQPPLNQRDQHDEILVTMDVDYDGNVVGVGQVYLNPEPSATWWDGMVWDHANEEWDDNTHDEGFARTQAWVDFPRTVDAIFRAQTAGDGWDIGIMSDIAFHLRKLGFTGSHIED